MGDSATIAERAAAGAAFLRTFDRIRIINLDERADRRRQVTAELARIGMSIDGEHVAFHPASRFADAGAFDSIGARGCFSSHLSLLRDAIASGVESVLVLEDDVRFSSPLAAAETMDQLADVRWSIFYGGYNATYAPKAASYDGLLGRIGPEEGFQGTHCVGFRREAIRSLVPYLTAMLARPAGDPAGGPMHVDGAYSWFRGEHPTIETWFAHPMLADQRPSRSDIHAPRMLERLPFVAPLLDVARAVKHRLGRR